MASVVEVKDAIVDVLADQLNPVGTPERERVDVFYGRKEADSDHPMVWVVDTATDYSSVRMRADSSLLRYDLVYHVQLEIVAGLRFRTQRDEEAAAYGLMDRVLTPLVRGDSIGRTLLAERLPRVEQVRPESDSWAVAPDDNRDPQYGVLTLQIAVELTRE